MTKIFLSSINDKKIEKIQKPMIIQCKNVFWRWKIETCHEMKNEKESTRDGRRRDGKWRRARRRS